jgi:MoaE-MoaD fusion protein
MRVRVVYFGLLKEIVGQGTQELDIPDQSPASFLWERLRSNHPELQRYERAIAIAVNQVYSKPDRELHDGDEVGFLPPVSGGVGEVTAVPATLPAVSEHARIQVEPIDAHSLVDNVKRDEDGAVTVFDGIVRNNTRGRKTLYLEYESYVTMAIAEMEKLAVKALGDFAVRDVRIVHRLGRIEIGDSSVLIVVASAHRGAAFDACRFVIDTLKKTVPIWKKEFFEDGAVWADGEPFPPDVKTV